MILIDDLSERVDSEAELCRQITAAEHARQTADALAAGFDRYHSKPGNPEDLGVVVADLLRR
jgi:CheY-like chemotaxis protein